MDAERYLFIHVMKTGGTSLRWVVEPLFSPEQRYPDLRGLDRPQMGTANIDPTPLRTLTREQRETIRFYSGHLPYYAVAMVPRPVVTMTLLRHPVERAVSFLKHAKRYTAEWADQRLEAIYDDLATNLTQIADHQSKVFSILPTDGAGTIVDVLAVDEERLRSAVHNLEQVDMVGLHEDYEGFLARVSARLGASLNARVRTRAGKEDWDVDAAFRRRIAADNRADLEFYEEARRIVAGQTGGRSDRVGRVQR